jgi:hypothetical protein
MNTQRIYPVLIAVVGPIISLTTLEANEVLAQPDLSLVSQRYVEESFSNEIVGEVISNGSEVADFAEATASFYDANGQIVGTEYGFADPSTVQPGMKSPFSIIVTGETISNEAASYSITLQWQDSGTNDFSKLVVENEPIGASSTTSNDVSPTSEDGSSDEEEN